jgi:hypothetical protein
MSGHAEDALHEDGVGLAGTPLLSKPLTPGELARRVRERLDARAS